MRGEALGDREQRLGGGAGEIDERRRDQAARAREIELGDVGSACAIASSASAETGVSSTPAALALAAAPATRAAFAPSPTIQRGTFVVRRGAEVAGHRGWHEHAVEIERSTLRARPR